MFPYKKHMKAMKLLIQYDMSYSTVIRELEYHYQAPFETGTESIVNGHLKTRIWACGQNIGLQKKTGVSPHVLKRRT